MCDRTTTDTGASQGDRRGKTGAGLIMGVALISALLLAGCAAPSQPTTPTTLGNITTCGAADCHPSEVKEASTGTHTALSCIDCHPGADTAHAADPKKVDAAMDWRIDACAKCHENEARTYLYDDNAQVGPFGGSQTEPKQPKTATFPAYNTIIAGQGFTKEYNEEGAHSVMMRAHFDIKRGKYETCIQCKSTKVVWAWTNAKPLTVATDTPVLLAHTKTPKAPAKTVMIPKGTVLTYSTDSKTREVNAKAVFPDGTTFSSVHGASEDVTKTLNTLWAATWAVTAETMPYGAGCNHCHDPHTGEDRVMRTSMLEAVAGTSPEATGGLNPYGTGKQLVKKLDGATRQDRENALCAQCHVEYTCGKSGVDGVDRDSFGWTKAGDLHAAYQKQFGYAQDWKHAIIGEALIKSQHPESELYWNSTHYRAGVACADCHMPEVYDASGKPFKSHWMTSPYKYEVQRYYEGLAQSANLDTKMQPGPCARCHEDRMAKGIAQQQQVYARQKIVQALLVQSINAIAAAKKAGTKADAALVTQAVDKHRQAHVRWENLIVSENSMGFHNFEEVMREMDAAETFANDAIAAAKQAVR